MPPNQTKKFMIRLSLLNKSSDFFEKSNKTKRAEYKKELGFIPYPYPPMLPMNFDS